MKFRQILPIVIVSFLTAYAAERYFQPSGMASGARETAFDRVVRSGTLHCGYEYWDGAVMRDTQTGEVYGPWVDLTNKLGKALGLRIDWTYQVGWGDVGVALKSGKIDAMCAGMWTSASKAKEIAFTTPLAFQALEAFVRTDEHRFDGGLESLNDPQVNMSVIDSDNSDFIAQGDFPKAHRVALSALNGTDSEQLIQVMNGKADVAFVAAGAWRQFEKSNPGKIRRLAPEHKLRAFGLAYAVDNQDHRMVQMLNTAIDEIHNSNDIDKVLDKANIDFPDMYIKLLKQF